MHFDKEIVGQSAFNGNFALGSERFQREIETVLGRRARHGQADSPNSMTMRTNRARCVQA